MSYTADPRTGYAVAFNITAATLIKTGPGLVAKIFIIVGASTAGSINDSATIVGAAIGNQISSTSTVGVSGVTGGYIVLEAPFSNGLVVTPGTGGTLAVAYS